MDDRPSGEQRSQGSNPATDVEDEGASAPEPSLVARIDRASGTPRSHGAGEGIADALERPASAPDEDAAQPLPEGDPDARSLQRIDGADAARGRHEGQPPGAIAAVEGTSGFSDIEGDAPGDVPEDPRTERRQP